MNNWFRDSETGDISHWCGGVAKNEDVKTGNVKPPETNTQLSKWFHPAPPLEAPEFNHKVKCNACGLEANREKDTFEMMGE